MGEGLKIALGDHKLNSTSTFVLVNDTALYHSSPGAYAGCREFADLNGVDEVVGLSFNGMTIGLYMTGLLLYSIGEVMKLSKDQSLKQWPARCFDFSFILAQNDALNHSHDWVTKIVEETDAKLKNEELKKLYAMAKVWEAGLTTLVQAAGMAMWIPLLYVQIDPCLKICQESMVGFVSNVLPADIDEDDALRLLQLSGAIAAATIFSLVVLLNLLFDFRKPLVHEAWWQSYLKGTISVLIVLILLGYTFSFGQKPGKKINVRNCDASPHKPKQHRQQKARGHLQNFDDDSDLPIDWVLFVWKQWWLISQGFQFVFRALQRCFYYTDAFKPPEEETERIAQSANHTHDDHRAQQELNERFKEQQFS